MRNRRLDAEHVADLVQLTTRNSNPEPDYDRVGSELAGTAPPSRATLRPPCHLRVERKIALRTQTWAVLRIAVHRILRARGVFLAGARHTLLSHAFLNFSYEIANSNWASQTTDQRMLRPNCSTIRTYACEAVDGFSRLRLRLAPVAHLLKKNGDGDKPFHSSSSARFALRKLNNLDPRTSR